MSTCRREGRVAGATPQSFDARRVAGAVPQSSDLRRRPAYRVRLGRCPSHPLLCIPIALVLALGPPAALAASPESASHSRANRVRGPAR